MRKALSLLAGIMVGVVTGGVLALLFAPLPGTKLREQIQSRVDTLIEEGKTAAEVRRQELEAQLESFKQGRPITLQNA